MKEVIPYDLFAILLYNERQRGLAHPLFASGIAKRSCGAWSSSSDEGITGAAAATRQPMLVGDVRNDPRYLPALDAVRTELAVPMMARGKLVGVIDLQSTRVQCL